MVLWYVVIAILAVDACFNWINSELPKYVVEQNFGLVDIFYRLLRIVAPWCLIYPIGTLTWHRPSILLSSFLYLLAFGVKKLTRHLAYKDELWYD